MIRHWDPQGNYKGGFLKEYDHWVLEVNHRQHTLGSFIIFAKRKVENYSDLNKSELNELVKVMKEIESALTKLFNPGRFNYLQLGNNVHYLHFHGIPRYKTNRKFDGKVWTDPSWGHFPPWIRTEIDKETLRKLKGKIEEQMA